MNKKNNNKKFKEQETALYAAYGKFAVKFENLCFALRMTIGLILNKAGLKKRKMIDILISNLYANQLRIYLKTMIEKTEDLSKTDRKILKNIFKRIENLIKKRNDIIHGTWFIGWTWFSPKKYEELDTALGYKHKKGGEIKSFKYKVENFDDFSKEAEILSNLIYKLLVCINKNYKFEEYLKFDEKGNII